MKQEKVIFEKALNVFAWLSFFLAIIITVITVLASFSDEQNGKKIFGIRFLIVNSDSMSKSESTVGEEIFFSAGDLIIIKNTEDPYSLEEGAVISFVSYNPESYGKTVTHKIRERQYSSDGKFEGYVTYGINTGVNDTILVEPEDIIGKYLFKIPTVGKIFSYLKTPRGYYLSVLVPCVLLIIFFSINVGRVLGKKEISKDTYSGEIENMRRRIERLEIKQKSVPYAVNSGALGVGTLDANPPQKAVADLSENVKVIPCSDNKKTQVLRNGFKEERIKENFFSEFFRHKR